MTTVPYLTPELALLTLEKVVQDAGPDYRYPYDTCEYVHEVESDEDGKLIEYTPRCIVGQVLDRLGWLTDPPSDRIANLIANNEEARSLADSGVVDPVAAQMLFTAQQIQDGTISSAAANSAAQARATRGTWGEALEAAKQVAIA